MDVMAWKSIAPAIIQNCFVKWGFGTADSFNVNSHDKSRQVELRGHIDCHSSFDKFLNVNKPVLPQVINQQVSTAPAAAHERQGQRDNGGKVKGKDKETMEERWTLLEAEAVIALSVLHSVISLCDADDKIMKAMAEL
jgi:hypothetical protein